MKTMNGRAIASHVIHKYFKLMILIALTLLGCNTKTNLSESETFLRKITEVHDRLESWSNYTGDVNYVVRQYLIDQPIYIDYNISLPEKSMQFKADHSGWKSRGFFAADSCDSRVVNKMRGAPSDKILFLGCEGASYLFDFHTFLLGIPSNLESSNPILSKSLDYDYVNGVACSVLTMTFDTEGTGQVWDFYFDSKTSLLKRARFRHLPDSSGGEFIDFEKPIISNDVLIYTERKWFANEDSSEVGWEIYELN